jgi:predicted Co/Zn/Cd cation transporter (cation efflux family)
MPRKITLLVIFILVVFTLIIKLLELLDGGFDMDKVLVCVWSLVALYYCIKVSQGIGEAHGPE